MYWQRVWGWFTYGELYSEMVKRFGDDAVFVEIGVWLGKSTLYMAEEIKKSGKNIKFYAIDPFEICGKMIDPFPVPARKGQPWTMEQSYFHDHWKKVSEPVKDYVQLLKGYSYDEVRGFEDESIDFVFIDGEHDYESVKKDIKDWLPKVKKGGVIAGHDYVQIHQGVIQAVTELLPMSIILHEQESWYYEKT